VQKASSREDQYEEQVRDLSARLKDAESKSESLFRENGNLQKLLDRTEAELDAEKEKYRTISAELDRTFAELTGF